MTRRIRFDELVVLVDGDSDLVSEMVTEGLVEYHEEGFCSVDVDRVLASRTLVRELDVNWAGVDIILRLRHELASARRRIALLEQGDDPPAQGESR